jgi:DNA-binding response OmpR family regulator
MWGQTPWRHDTCGLRFKTYDMTQAAVKRILVVEDDDLIRASIADALLLEGYTVDTAANGALALDQVKRAQPDVIVLDLMMPVMDGWAFIGAFRDEAACAEVPVLVMSAYDKLGETAPGLRVQACIAKPFDLDVLLGAIERLLRSAPPITAGLMPSPTDRNLQELA